METQNASVSIMNIIILCEACNQHLLYCGCIVCSGAPDCMALNREPCTTVRNTCGSCFRRHLGQEGFSNDPCFGEQILDIAMHI